MTQQEGEGRPRSPFSEQSLQVITMAQKEARDLRHGHVGTGHIFLALMQNEDVRKIMEKLDLKQDLLLARSTLKNLYGSHHSKKEPQITARLGTVIQYATREARKEGASEITPLHIWRGLLLSGEGEMEVMVEALKTERSE
ncbi:MAG: Clp protease N-terminal domain-containing protein [Candidatus Levybacteria bacterium]|nr:Clp protease N-terminal domain-containing protein [Candidatus Levybacteria bacterium]